MSDNTGKNPRVITRIYNRATGMWEVDVHRPMDYDFTVIGDKPLSCYREDFHTMPDIDTMNAVDLRAKAALDF